MPKKRAQDRRDKNLLFRVSKAEYEQFSDEAKKRHMEKAELFRYLTARYFVDDKK
jgi:hypothetical protein